MPLAIFAVAVVGIAIIAALVWILWDEMSKPPITQADLDAVFPPKGPSHEP